MDNLLEDPESNVEEQETESEFELDEASDTEEEDEDALLEEEDEEEEFEIDENLKEKLDEKSLKRLKDHLKGAEKARKQAQELKERYSNVEALVKALENKDTAEQALRMITKAVEDAHGIRLNDDQEEEDDDLDAEWLTVAKKKVVEPAVKGIAQKYEARIAELEKAVKAHQEEKEKEYAKLAISKVKGYVKSRYPGLNVTLEQVAEAVRRYPELAGKPITAWLKTNGDLIAKYEGKHPPRVSKMPKSGNSSQKARDVRELRFEDYLAGEG